MTEFYALMLARDCPPRRQIIWAKQRPKERGRLRWHMLHDPVGQAILILAAGYEQHSVGVFAEIVGRTYRVEELLAGMIKHYAVAGDKDAVWKLDKVLDSRELSPNDIEQLAAFVQVGDAYALVALPTQRKFARFARDIAMGRKKDRDAWVANALDCAKQVLTKRPDLAGPGKKSQIARIVKERLKLAQSIHTIRKYIEVEDS